jgi:hypothetical protein
MPGRVVESILLLAGVFSVRPWLECPERVGRVICGVSRMIAANTAFIKIVRLIDLIGSLQLFKQMSVALNLEPDHTSEQSISLSRNCLTNFSPV